MPGRVSLGRCWNWVAGTDGNGYGNFIESRKNGKISWGGGAHVYSYFLAHGKMPEKGQFVCHECDNRLCVNPNHLFLGSRRDNMKDCSRKGRIINGVIAHKAVKRSNLEHYTEDELKQAVRAIEREIEDRGES